MTVNAYAKINWHLQVVGQRTDGYHLLDMLMQRIALHDVLTFSPAVQITLRVTGPDVGSVQDNLVWRAAHTLQAYTGCRQGAAIQLQKNIPAGAGLGGGSADAAAALQLLNELWQLHLPAPVLAQIGLQLGADIPYCLTDGPARVQGIGETVLPLAPLPSYDLLILQPQGRLSTKEVFATRRTQALPMAAPIHTALAEQALRQGDWASLRRWAQNDLQPAASRMMPALQAAIDDLYQAGSLFAQMTGSGSAVFGVFAQDDPARQRAQRLLAAVYPFCLASATH